MVGARILLRRAQSTVRRARKLAAVDKLSMDKDWTALQEICPLPHYGYSKRKKKLGILKFEGDDLIREYLEANPKLARKPLDMRNHRMVPIKTTVLLEKDPDAHKKNYPFVTEKELNAEVLQDQELEKMGKAQGTLRAVQEAEEVMLRRALKERRDDFAGLKTDPAKEK
jgi:hypothetical protein